MERRGVNYFPFNVGDYAAHTAHLEPMEDLAYRRLLDQYYLREGPLPADIQVTAKLVRMRSMADDVESVLREFFLLTEDGWRHFRCDAEILRMQDKQAKARASAEASVNARRANAQQMRANAERSLPQEKTDVELPTPTSTPIEEQEKARKRAPAQVARPDDVDDQVWSDFIELRRAKKAPVTATVVASARAEAQKAELTLEAFFRVWCARGSQGLEAAWLKPQERGAVQPMTFRERDTANAAARVHEMTGGLVSAKPIPITRRNDALQEVFDAHDTALRLG